MNLYPNILRLFRFTTPGDSPGEGLLGPGAICVNMPDQILYVQCEDKLIAFRGVVVPYGNITPAEIEARRLPPQPETPPPPPEPPRRSLWQIFWGLTS